MQTNELIVPPIAKDIEFQNEENNPQENNIFD